MDLLKWQLSDGVIDNMTQQLNIGDRAKTNVAANTALSILMSALAKNSTQSESAISGLAGALDRDHDGSILDDVMGMLSGTAQTKSQKTMNGAGILGHLLGQKQSSAIEMLTKMSGLDTNQSTNMLVKLAPMVLGVLGRLKKQNQMQSSDLQSYLKQSQQQFLKEDQDRSVFEKLLDQDGDGSIGDEIASIGLKVIGNLFKR